MVHDIGLGGKRLKLAGQHLDLHAQGVEPLRRRNPLFQKAFAPVQLGLGMGELRLQRALLRAKRIALEGQLLILDPPDGLPRRHPVTLDDRQLHQRPPQPRPRRDAVARLDLAIDRLPFGDGDGAQRLGQGGQRAKRQEGETEKRAHGGNPWGGYHI